MPVPQPPSVTHGTAPAPNTGTQANEPAWQRALANAQSSAQQSNGATRHDAQTATAKATAKEQDIRNKDHAALPIPPVSTGGKAPEQSGKRKAAPTTPSVVPTSIKKDSKKDNHLVNPATAQAVPIHHTPDKPADDGTTKVQTPNDQAVNHIETTAADPKTSLPHPVPGQDSPKADTEDNNSSTSSSTVEDSGPIPAHTSPTAKPAVQTNSAATSDGQQSPGVQSGATTAANAPAPDDTPPVTGPTQNTPQHHAATAPPQITAAQPAISSTMQALTARAAQMPETSISIAEGKEKDSTPPITSLGGVAASSPTPPAFTTSANAVAAAPNAADASSTNTGPSALAAMVTALHQSGQTSTVLQLDPPGLGHLSVQVGLGAQGQVNVLFVPSTADAAQAIQSSLGGLGSAMAQSGLTLGQAQVGGQFHQQGGHGGQNGQPSPRQGGTSAFNTETQAPTSGLSAYA